MRIGSSARVVVAGELGKMTQVVNLTMLSQHGYEPVVILNVGRLGGEHQRGKLRAPAGFACRSRPCISYVGTVAARTAALDRVDALAVENRRTRRA